MPKQQGQGASPPNAKFARFVDQAARRAGYDMDRGGSGRAELAKAMGMTVWPIGRWLSGDALPKPENFPRLAAALRVSVHDLLAAAGIYDQADTGANQPNGANQDVRSGPGADPVTPDAAADLLGITHPVARRMLIQNMQQALDLQAELDGGTDEVAASGG